MSIQNNTPPPPDVEPKFQMHAKTKMMERMNLMMGKHGNVAGIYTQEVRKVEAQHKSNNGSGAERPSGGLIMRILRTLMILVMVVLRMRS